MNHDDHDADFDAFEADLKALRPRAPSAGFAERVAVEADLRSLRPRAPSPGFADRVVTASTAPAKSFGNILRFPALAVPLAAAAALALAFLPELLHTEKISPTGPPAVVATAEPARAPAAGDFTALPDEAIHLPVINLGDGRAYRPVIRRRYAAPESFRARPGGAVMPVSFRASSGVDYEPVVFE